MLSILLRLGSSRRFPLFFALPISTITVSIIIIISINNNYDYYYLLLLIMLLLISYFPTRLE